MLTKCLCCDHRRQLKTVHSTNYSRIFTQNRRQIPIHQKIRNITVIRRRFKKDFLKSQRRSITRQSRSQRSSFKVNKSTTTNQIYIINTYQKSILKKYGSPFTIFIIEKRFDASTGTIMPNTFYSDYLDDLPFCASMFSCQWRNSICFFCFFLYPSLVFLREFRIWMVYSVLGVFELRYTVDIDLSRSCS